MSSNLGVSQDFWDSLYAGTDLWVDRSDQNIMHYAVRELYFSVVVGGEPLPQQKPPMGEKQLILPMISEQSDRDRLVWSSLTRMFGTEEQALAAALMSLHESLYYVDPEDEVDSTV